MGKQQLESELSATTSRLNRSLSETKPGVEALKSDNTRLVSRLAAMENENETLREVHDVLQPSFYFNTSF